MNTEKAVRTLLLVEDEALIAMAEAKNLQRYGYQVMTVLSGEKAIALLEENPHIDLILMDIDLGRGMNGPEAAEIILGKHDIPVVFLSSHTEPEIVGKTEKITSYGYVVKNSNITVLDASIKMAFKLFEANKTILERDEKYRQLADNVSDVLWILNLKTGKWVYISPSVEKLRGYTVDEVMGQSLEQTMTPASYASVQSVSSAQIPQDENTAFTNYELISEIEQTRKDGTTVWTEALTRLTRNDNGEPLVIGVSRDISARKRAEMVASETRQIYESIFHLSPEALLLTTEREGRYLAVSDAHERLTGHRADEVIGHTVSEFSIWGTPTKRDAIIQRLQEEGDVHNVDLRFHRKNGEAFDALLSMARVEIGGERCIVSMVTDITRQKRMEEDLRISEARFRNMLQDIQSVAVQGYALDGTTQYWNKASELLYGYTAEEAIGRNLLDLIIPSEMRDGVGQAIRQMSETGKPIPASEMSLQRKDGSRVEVYSSHAIIQIPGKSQELFCMDIDLDWRGKKELLK